MFLEIKICLTHRVEALLQSPDHYSECNLWVGRREKPKKRVLPPLLVLHWYPSNSLAGLGYGTESLENPSAQFMFNNPFEILDCGICADSFGIGKQRRTVQLCYAMEPMCS